MISYNNRGGFIKTRIMILEKSGRRRRMAEGAEEEAKMLIMWRQRQNCHTENADFAVGGGGGVVENWGRRCWLSNVWGGGGVDISPQQQTHH
jgi:hypothetical protein